MVRHKQRCSTCGNGKPTTTKHRSISGKLVYGYDCPIAGMYIGSFDAGWVVRCGCASWVPREK